MIRRAETDGDLAAYAQVWSTARPRDPISGAEVRKRLSRNPERVHLLDEVGGRVVGVGSVGKTSAPGVGFALVSVLPDSRRRGIGSELLAACLEHARAVGRDAVGATVWSDDRDSVEWAVRRGFFEASRDVELRRDVGADEPQPTPPSGVTIVELTDEQAEGAYAVELEALPDIPGPDRLEADPFERWRDNLRASAAAFAALEGARVVGFAWLETRDEGARLLDHGLTAVLRSHRRRGIATALKQAQIAWAAEHGYRTLMTSTDGPNVGMRRVNERLGYRALPPKIRLRKELGR